MTNTTNTNLTRANRVAIQVIGTGYKADFYRTHKKLATLLSEETTWEMDESMNKSAQREDFRKYAIEHADAVGILWDPSDKRTDTNKRIPKYETEAQLLEDVRDMMEEDIRNLVEGCGQAINYVGIPAHEMVATPMTHSAKGVDLSKLGIIDGKYERTGNWAWATIEVIAVMMASNGQEIYYTFNCQLVSGQLKKPHITKTSFNESIKESLKEIGLLEEVKEEVKEEEVQKPKKSKSKKSKKETATA